MHALDKLLNEADMAERLGFTRKWLREKRLGGEGPPHIWLGNRVMYDPDDVWSWIETLKSTASNEAKNGN